MRGEKVILPVVTTALLGAVWDLAVRLTHTKIFPPPHEVVRGLVQLGQKNILWHYASDSLLRVLTGYLVAAVIAVPLGVVFGRMPLLDRMFNPIVQMLRPISPLAWIPLAVIWFGVSNMAPIFLIFLASFFPIVVATATAVREVPPVFVQAGRNLGLSNSQLMRRIILPAVLPHILVALRIAFGIAWIVLVASEMIAVDSGLGYLIIDARNAGKRYDLVVGGMLIIGALGLLLDWIFRAAERLPKLRWGFRD